MVQFQSRLGFVLIITQLLRNSSNHYGQAESFILPSSTISFANNPSSSSSITGARAQSLVESRTNKISLNSKNNGADGTNKNPDADVDTDTDSDAAAAQQKSDTPENTTNTKNQNDNSKRAMLQFALPALGIFLASPLLSNIDNAFVGRTVGTKGLAALSPATICTDQMLYLFSFLSRATTGIVSRAYSSKEHTTEEDRVSAARDAASTPLSVALFSGTLLSVFYALFTPKMLDMLNVDPVLRPASASYVYWRGAIAWAALAQNVSLSTLLATRDAISPLKIIALAAGINVIGDYALCVYPLQWGTSGAAAATAFATLFSSAFLLKDLAKKKMLPKVSIIPASMAKLKELFDYVGPLFTITIARLIGFVSMQRAAMRCGVQPLAAYQICVNSLIFFLLFGEPLSQLHQTKLPSLLDADDQDSSYSTIKSVMTLASFAAFGVGAVAFATLMLGSGSFTADAAVQTMVRDTAPSVCLAIVTAIVTVAIDGAMLAARDFGFIIAIGMMTCIMQVYLSSQCSTLSHIFLAFALRLGVYSVAAVSRVGLGFGTLGKVLRRRKDERDGVEANGYSVVRQ
jgi:Na+-driven multidrug efflux pump